MKTYAVPLRLLLLLLLATPAVADLPLIEAFGKLPAESNPVLNGDGRWLAWVDQREENPRIVIYDIANHRVHRMLAGGASLRGMVWGNDDVLLITYQATWVSSISPHERHSYNRYAALTAQEGPARILPLARTGKDVSEVTGHLMHARGGQPHSAIMFLPTYCHCAVSVDTLSGEFKQISDGRPQTIGWVVDRQDNPVLREDWDAKTHTYRLVVQHDDSEKPLQLLRQSDADMPQVRGATADGKAVVLLTNNGRAHQAAWALPLDGSPMQLLVEDPEADVTNVFTDPLSGAITGAYVSGSVTTVRWLDPLIAKRQEALKKMFPDREVWQVGWTDDGSKVLAQVQGPALAPTYYLVDYKTHRADIAAEEYPLLAGFELATAQEISYAARDGTQIPAYLTPPPHSHGPLPLVVLPHDGPAARDYRLFNWMVQFLVSRGYAVLQPQYRGSSGFGDAWLRAGFRQWGGLMQDDVTDGVQAMIKLGIADPQRVCIIGTGYGGYVALAGAAFTSDLYRCAVSVGGVADIDELVHDAKPKVFRAIASNELGIKERIGSEGDANLRRRSPINFATNIHIPLLLLDGIGDTEEVKHQSERMADAMRKAGRSVELSQFRTHNEMLREIEDFLKANL